MKVALVNPNWTFDGSIYFGCREPHLPLEFGYARALLERAAALTPPPAEPPDDPAIERVVAAVRVIGRRAARVTEADVREIQALAGSEPFWGDRGRAAVRPEGHGEVRPRPPPAARE